MALNRNQKQAISRFFAAELIGKELRVISGSCKDLQKVVGRIVDETTNTFVVQYNGKRKIIPKSTCVFCIDGVEINGAKLVGRPEDRTKKFM